MYLHLVGYQTEKGISNVDHGFGWNIVGPASQKVAQHYSQFGQCIWVMAFLATGDEIVTSIAIVAKQLLL